MIFASGDSFQEILTRLSVLRYIITSNCKAGRTDTSLESEHFYCQILNLALGTNLANLNSNKTKYPAIDLGDKLSGYGIQVTANNSREKILHTLALYTKHRVYEQFPKLRLFILSSKKDYQEGLKVEEPFLFDPKRDIWDLDDLMFQIEKNRNTIPAIEMFVRRELPTVSVAITDERSILFGIQPDPSKPFTSGESFLKYCNLAPNSDEWNEATARMSTLFDLLRNRTDNSTRAFLCRMIELSQFVDQRWENGIFVFPQFFQGMTKTNRFVFEKHFQQLSFYGLASYTDDPPIRVFLHCHLGASDINFFKAIKEFFSDDPQRLKQLIQHMNFSLLD